jgi:hypothetical protein
MRGESMKELKTCVPNVATYCYALNKAEPVCDFEPALRVYPESPEGVQVQVRVRSGRGGAGKQKMIAGVTLGADDVRELRDYLGLVLRDHFKERP